MSELKLSYPGEHPRLMLGHVGGMYTAGSLVHLLGGREAYIPGWWEESIYPGRERGSLPSIPPSSTNSETGRDLSGEPVWPRIAFFID